MDSTGHFSYLGQLKGHNGWVTALATPADNSEWVLTASRDKTIVKWKIERGEDGYVTGVPQRSLLGHSNFVQDVQLSSDGQFALSSSWDCSMRLWDLSNGLCTRKFTGHNKDVMTCAFSADNRQIVSGSRDQQMKVLFGLFFRKTRKQQGDHNSENSPKIAKPSTVLPIYLSPPAFTRRCGTPLVSASTPSMKMDTPTGCPACASTPTRRRP